MSKADLIEILQWAPALRELFSVGAFHNILLEMLTPEIDSEDDWDPLCPLLESLELHLQLATEQLIDFIERRWETTFGNQAVAQIKRICITFMSSHQRDESWGWDEAAWGRRIEQWRSEGLDLITTDINWGAQPFGGESSNGSEI